LLRSIPAPLNYNGFTSGQKIRDARRRRKMKRREEQERKREWRRLHLLESGDYDEYGSYNPDKKFNTKRQNRKKRRKERLNSKANGGTTTPTTKPTKPPKKNKNKKKQITKAPPTTRPFRELGIDDFDDFDNTTPKSTKPTTTTKQITTTEVTTVMTTVKQKTKPVNPGKLVDMREDAFHFEAEDFANATLADIEYHNWAAAMAAAEQWGDKKGIKTLKKYELLKNMMVYLQENDGRVFSRFSQYGCWCFQSFDYDFWKGQGYPKDGIDKTCRKLSLCYHCIAQDFEECNPESTYSFVGLEDVVTKDRVIQCLDEEGSCKRNICECDKKFAEGLRNEAQTFNIGFDTT
jgi:hypothetical protein